jgi:hypothetical protein
MSSRKGDMKLYPLNQQLFCVRLHDIIDRTQGKSFNFTYRVALAGHKNDGYRHRFLVALEFFNYIKTAHSGHINIEQNYAWSQVYKKLKHLINGRSGKKVKFT